jgi:hypothetical protein
MVVSASVVRRFIVCPLGSTNSSLSGAGSAMVASARYAREAARVVAITVLPTLLARANEVIE